MTLGERVLLLRRRCKLSQRQLAEAIEVQPNTIARLERGEIHDLVGAKIVRLARVLKISTDVLLGVVPLDDDIGEYSPTALALAGTEPSAVGCSDVGTSYRGV